MPTGTWPRPIPNRATGVPHQRSMQRRCLPCLWKQRWTSATTPPSGARQRPRRRLLLPRRGPAHGHRHGSGGGRHTEVTATPGVATASPGQGGLPLPAMMPPPALRHLCRGCSSRDSHLGSGGCQPAGLAPGGQQLAFRSTNPSYLGLNVTNLGSKESHQVTVHPEDSTPAWSPDKTQLVFASNMHGDRKWRIYVISPGAVRSEGEEWAYGNMPAWSPVAAADSRADCLRLQRAWRRVQRMGDESRRLWSGRLTTDPSNDTAPAWSLTASR